MNEKPQSIWKSWFALLLCHCLLVHALMLMLRVGATYQAIRIGLDGFWIGVIGGAFGALPAVLGLHIGSIVVLVGIATSGIGAAGVLVATSGTLAAAAAVSARHFGLKFR